ncbi:MAG: hypothetical protein AAFX85_01140 [Pseudomonadota bacterium]
MHATFRIVTRLTILFALLAATSAHALRPGEMIIREHSAETTVLDLTLFSDSTGTIRAKRCDDCPVLTLTVDGTTVVRRAGQVQSLRTAELDRDRGATVFFDPKTLIVTRILLRR